MKKKRWVSGYEEGKEQKQKKWGEGGGGLDNRQADAKTRIRRKDIIANVAQRTNRV